MLLDESNAVIHNNSSYPKEAAKVLRNQTCESIIRNLTQGANVSVPYHASLDQHVRVLAWKGCTTLLFDFDKAQRHCISVMYLIFVSWLASPHYSTCRNNQEV